MRVNYLKAFLFVCCTSMMLSCEEDSDDENGIVDKAEMSTILVGGQWEITYYFDDTDETADYNGYILTFQEGGSVSATNGDTALTGTWSITDSDASDDSTDGSLEFNLFFANPDIFEELTDDWDILTYSNTKIELSDVSGGDGTTDFLTFEKM